MLPRESTIPLTQNRSPRTTAQMSYSIKKIGNVSVSGALILIRDFNFSDINYEYHTVMRSESGKYIKKKCLR